MTNSKEVINLIRDMESNGSRTEKARLLSLMADNDLGRDVIRYAYDPFKTYGLTPPRQPGEGTASLKTSILKSLCDKLSMRELTGDAAKREVCDVMTYLNADSAEILYRVLSKDLKCGIAESTIVSAVPGLIPVFSVMRAHKFEERHIKSWPQIVEPKYDGFRVTFLCRNGEGGFFTRSGKRMKSLDSLVPIVMSHVSSMTENSHPDIYQAIYATDPDKMNFVFDSETMTGSFNDTSGDLRRESKQAENVTCYIFDFMTFEEFDNTGTHATDYIERRRLVEQFVIDAPKGITKTERYYANSFAEIHDHYGKFRDRGLEGAMVKDPSGGYEKKKSRKWLKIKAEETEDLKIIGAYPGEPNTKYEHCLGGLIVDRDGVKVNVGGGFSDIQREEIWKLWTEDKQYPKFVEDHPITDRPLVNRLVEVKFHEVTPDGSLRHPRFIRFRDDKDGEKENNKAA